MLDLSHRADLVWLAELVDELSAAAPGVQPLVVGALARDLWLHYAHDIAIDRKTQDVDFALAVDWAAFAKIRDALLANGQCESVRNSAHRLRHRKFGWLDLLPFGTVERTDGTIAWPPGGEIIMNMQGYAEANAAAVSVVLAQAQTARIVSLPMLAVLKTLAWKERHRQTQGKDAIDLALILRRYLEAGNLDRLYGEFAHLIDDRFDFDVAGAWMLGWDARAQLLKHSLRFDRLLDALNQVLQPELAEDGAKTLVMQMNSFVPDDALKLLSAFRRGLLGSTKP